MKKNYKRILAIGVVLIVCLMTITGCTSKKKLKEAETTYQNLLAESQAALSALEKEAAEVKSKNEELEKENKELQTNLTRVLSDKSDITTRDQVMTDLMDIYSLYQSGKNDEALEKIKKIEPIGFDDETLAFYELLKDVLE